MWKDVDGKVVWIPHEVSEREGIVREESIKGELNRSDDRLLLLSSNPHST